VPELTLRPEEHAMPRLRFDISISLDGYVAGPGQSMDEPLGAGGERLHDWALKLASWREQHGREGGEVNADTRVMDEQMQGVGAVIMGRGMFCGGGRTGAWPEPAWNGWWGDDPPFHVPVYVLTSHARDSQEMEGGTSFHFVTEGPGAALEQARAAAPGADWILIAGGANTINQYLRAGLVDEFQLHVSPILLGGGERLFDDLGDAPPKLERTREIEGPTVTHLRYRVL
jgi:dihydrofolate reductase